MPVMLKDNIGIAALLEVKTSSALHMPSQHVLVPNAHINWNPEFADVKLIQTLMLTNELNNIVMKAQTERGIGFKTPIPGMLGVPVIMCCNLNSLLQCGGVPENRPDHSLTHLLTHSHSHYLSFISCIYLISLFTLTCHMTFFSQATPTFIAAFLFGVAFGAL